MGWKFGQAILLYNTKIPGSVKVLNHQTFSEPEVLAVELLFSVLSTKLV